MFCDLRWYLRKSRARLNDARRSVLRELLRTEPRWVRGHLELGLSEVESIVQGEERPQPRAIATIRISANSALQLLSSSSSFRLAQERECATAHYLLGMVSFFLKDFEDALTRFRILIPGAKLPFGLLKRSIDYAAAAALALGHHEEAAQYQQHLSTMR